MPHVFLEALTAYQAAARKRVPVTNDAIESSVDALFWRMVNTPPRTVGNLIAKGRAMLGEYGETGELRTDLVGVLIDDIQTIN